MKLRARFNPQRWPLSAHPPMTNGVPPPPTPLVKPESAEIPSPREPQAPANQEKSTVAQPAPVSAVVQPPKQPSVKFLSRVWAPGKRPESKVMTKTVTSATQSTITIPLSSSLPTAMDDKKSIAVAEWVEVKNKKAKKPTLAKVIN